MPQTSSVVILSPCAATCLCAPEPLHDVVTMHSQVLQGQPSLNDVVDVVPRYFKVNLYCDCPFWPDDGMCMLRDCGVCECEPDEVPAPWKDADSAASCEGDRPG